MPFYDVEGYATRVSSQTKKPGLRQAQTALARMRIAEAARDSFLADGYVATSMNTIARAAGVSVQTIYNTVGNKAAVLSAVVDLVAAGPAAPTSVRTFMQERTQATHTLTDMLGVLAEWFVDVHPRLADVFRLIRQAAAVDPEVAALEHDRASQRLTNYSLAAARVRALGGLTNGLSDEEAAAMIWSLGHPDTYRFLVHDHRWSLERYRLWLAASLAAALQ